MLLDAQSCLKNKNKKKQPMNTAHPDTLVNNLCEVIKYKMDNTYLI